VSVYTEPVWEEPPMHARQRGYEDVLRPLMDKPEHWARIGEYASSDSAYQAARNLRQRKYRVPAPDHEWEFVHFGQFVWACYYGEVDRD